ncbi:HAMP domain-containing histidine kinase [Shewanella sp. Scap07]|uniref:sensor histidine kinase n=1 Tax=Shewanella sp. Scap07 TaxID=2589987 RepID=UPI0015C05044|nr:HAMP domain-containing sensor histidine kinase [Shewanella sp. Scap07]QLE83934.1 HAMP domain-containing histidine kinase [Shewanella sp. Scap07]
MNFIQSIRFRIIVACVFFSIVVSVCYTWVTFFGLKYNSDELFNWYLTQEAQVLLAQYQRAPQQDLSSMTSAQVRVTSEDKALATLAEYFPDPSVKARILRHQSLQDLDILGPVFTTAQGFTIYEFSARKKNIHVLKAAIEGGDLATHFYYFADVSGFVNYDNNSEKRILNKFINVLVVIFLLSLIIGFWLAKQVVSPLTRLASSVDADNYQQYQQNRGKYYNDEIGFLAKQIDRFVAKSHQMIEREKAFSRDVSHELRTPLATSRAAIELALAAPEGQQQHMAKFLNRAVRANADMSHLIETFLLLGKQEQDGEQHSQFDLHELVQCSMNKHDYLKRSPDIESVNLIAPSLMLVASKRYLAIVLDNLIRNAYQHTYQGQIVVSMKGSCIVVEDSGEGMVCSQAAAERHDNVLEKSGLGLSIVSRLCEKLGWQITIDSEREQGTAIIIDVTAAALPQ